MRGVCKAWPRQVVAVVATLALVFACVTGTYHHAAGHHSDALAGYAEGHGDHAAPATTQHAHSHCDHHKTDPGNSHADCCDFICHGGFAILCATCIMPQLMQPALVILPAQLPVGVQPASLERPPRSPALA